MILYKIIPVFFVLFISISDSYGEELFSPEIVFNRMIGVYKKLNSYSDEGVRTIFFYKNKKFHHKDVQEFETYYMSPNTFKFKWIDYYSGSGPEENFLENIDGEINLKKWNKKPIKYDSLNKAISRVTGTTGRAIYWLPRFFLKDVFCPDFTKIKLKYIGDSNVLGRNAYMIEIIYKSGDSEVVWIDKGDYTLVKIKNKSQLLAYEIVNEIMYKNVHVGKN